MPLRPFRTRRASNQGTSPDDAKTETPLVLIVFLFHNPLVQRPADKAETCGVGPHAPSYVKPNISADMVVSASHGLIARDIEGGRKRDKEGIHYHGSRFRDVGRKKKKGQKQ